MFHAYLRAKKSTSSLNSLGYCKEVANLSFWVIWACLARQTLHDNSNLKKSLKFICCRQKIKFILDVFPEILQRYCKLIVLGTLCMPRYANQSDTINLQKTFVFICRRKINFTTTLFWRYCKDIDFLLWVL